MSDENKWNWRESASFLSGFYYGLSGVFVSMALPEGGATTLPLRGLCLAAFLLLQVTAYKIRKDAKSCPRDV